MATIRIIPTIVIPLFRGGKGGGGGIVSLIIALIALLTWLRMSPGYSDGAEEGIEIELRRTKHYRDGSEARIELDIRRSRRIIQRDEPTPGPSPPPSGVRLPSLETGTATIAPGRVIRVGPTGSSGTG